jgi:hypothetical protein
MVAHPQLRFGAKEKPRPGCGRAGGWRGSGGVSSGMSQPDTDASDLRAKAFEDRITRGEWRVEKTDDDGGIEVAVFGGPDARWRAIRYAADKYGVFGVIWLEPYRR